MADCEAVWIQVTKESSHSWACSGPMRGGRRNETSDLDVLIDFDSQVNLIDLIGLEQELTEVLGIKVDLITLRSVKAALRHSIESDLIRLG